MRLEALETDPALRRLRAGELDVAVVWHVYAGRDGGEAGLERQHLADDPYRIVLPPAHRLARRRSVGLRDLAGERFSGPRGGEPERDAYRRFLTEACAAEDFEPDIAYEVTDVAVSRAFVAAGIAVAVLPELTIGQPRPDVVVHPLPREDPFRSIYAVWRSGRRVPAVAPMLRCLADAAADRLGGAR